MEMRYRKLIFDIVSVFNEDYNWFESRYEKAIVNKNLDRNATLLILQKDIMNFRTSLIKMMESIKFENTTKELGEILNKTNSLLGEVGKLTADVLK